jgi:CubicO group peptidase (beta-lactamase class C family)
MKMERILKSHLIPLTILLVTASCNISTAAQNASEDAEKYICQGKNEGVYWPTKEWRAAKPEEVGMNSQKLAKAIESAADPQYKTDGVAIIKNGYIVAEAYLGAFQKDTKHDSYSLSKSFTSALVGIAIDKGLISGVDEKLCQYFDEWRCDDDTRNKISIRHALTLTTGLKWHEDWVNIDPDTNDTIKMIYSQKFLEYMLNREAIHEPGEVFTYSTGDPMLMSGVISKATGMSALGFARENLFQHIGISSVQWDSDSQGYTATFAMLHLTVRDYAKFGYLYLNKGKWEDKQIVSEEWVNMSTRTDPSVRMWKAYGYLWHVNLPLRLGARDSNIPADGYMAEGVLGQNIIIIPSKDLVIVKVANSEGRGIDLVKFLTLVLDAIDEGNPATSAKRTAMMVESLTPEGWELHDRVTQFTPENLYEQINGRAEYYLAYDVMGMTFASFDKSTDNSVFIDLSIYDMGTPTNAFGVFSGERPVEAPRLRLGRDAYRMGANHYIFQGQYYIQITAAGNTDEVRQVCMDLAERVTDFLQDSGQPLWGLVALPEADRVPQSAQYFLVDALGLDFMRNTYTAKYYKGKSIVSVFLSQQDSPESARETVAKFKEHANLYGKGVDILSEDGVELVSCDMDGSYDVVFQKGSLVAGVTEVKDKRLAVEATIDLWKQLQTE